jgi:uncharacterized membrane protein
MSSSYDPTKDSTPVLAKKARDTGRLVLDISDSACLCGCMEPTSGRFRPGHDARLKGRLLRAHLNKVGVLIVKDGKEQAMTARAYAKEVSSDAYDWTAALDRAWEKQKSAAAALRAKVESAKAERSAKDAAQEKAVQTGGEASVEEMVEEGEAAATSAG